MSEYEPAFKLPPSRAAVASFVLGLIELPFAATYLVYCYLSPAVVVLQGGSRAGLNPLLDPYFYFALLGALLPSALAIGALRIAWVGGEVKVLKLAWLVFGFGLISLALVVLGAITYARDVAAR